MVLGAANLIGVAEVQSEIFTGGHQLVFDNPTAISFRAQVRIERLTGFAQEIQEVSFDAQIVILATATQPDFAACFDDFIMAELFSGSGVSDGGFTPATGLSCGAIERSIAEL